MTATPSIDLSGRLTEQLAEASPDLLRQMIFGAKSTVLNLWWSSTRRWTSGTTDDTMLVTIRVMGVAFVAFMLFVAFVIFRNGLTYAFQNFGR